MKKVYFKLDSIKNNEKNRPAGYLEEVLSLGTIKENLLEIDENKALYLIEKYTPKFFDKTQKKEVNNFPSFAKMAINLANSIVKEFGFKNTSQPKLSIEEKIKRQEICSSCSFFHKESFRCKKCGCFLKWKTSWKTQKCPIGKW